MTTALDIYDQPFFNATAETIPPFAVMQQSWQGTVEDRDYFKAVKPNSQGKKYLLNGMTPVAPGKPGRGTTARGAFALFDPMITPIADEELGPIPGTWHLGRLGSGFLVDGEIAGSPPNQPGFPTQASTKRVRVTIQATAGKATQLARFELKEDKNLPSPPFATAYLLDANDQRLKDDGNQEIEIIVIDRQGTRFAGFGPYEDKKFGQQRGYRGWGQFVDGNYGGSGKLGYEIIDMEGQARWLQGKIADDWTTSNQTGEIEVEAFWGASPNSRAPKTREKDYGGGGTGAPSSKKNIVDIIDPAKLRTGTLKKDKVVLAVFDETQNKYVLATSGGENFVRIKGTAATMVTPSMEKFLLRDVVSVCGPAPAEEVTVHNSPKIKCPPGTTIYAMFDRTKGTSEEQNEDSWTTADMENIRWILEGFAQQGGATQVLELGAGAPGWINSGAC